MSKQQSREQHRPNTDERFELGRRTFIGTTAGIATVGLSKAAGTTVGSTTSEPDTPLVYVGHADTIEAFDASTGESKWTFSADGAAHASPTVVNGILYANGDRDEGGSVYAVDAATGEERWTFTEPGDRVSHGPTVVDGTVYVGEGGNEELEDVNYSVYAIDAITGAEMWQYDEVGGRVTATPHYADGTVYAGSRTGDVHAIDAETGQQEWTFDTDGFIRGSPTAYDNTLYVSSEWGGLFALDTESGDERWSLTEAVRSVRSSPTVVDGTVFFGSARFDDDPTEMWAVDAATGDTEWRFDTETEIRRSPTVFDGTVYIVDGTGSEGGTVYAIDADTGDEVWSEPQPDGHQTTASPTVHDGMVYLSFGSGGTLWALDAESGAERWSNEDLGFSMWSSPTVVTDPQNGHSVDSRVELGTDGHHHVWPGAALGLWAEFTVTPETPEAAQEVTLDASPTIGKIESYEWEIITQDDGPGSGMETTYTFEQAGEYDITLTVTDTEGGTDSTTETVEVTEESGTEQEDDGAEDEALDENEVQQDDTHVDDDGPGFGPASGLAGLGGVAYLLKRRLTGETDRERED